MALHALDDELARERTAAAVLDGVAEFVGRGGFADDAVVDDLVACPQCFHHPDRAVHRRALFVGRDQQCDRARVRRMFCNESLNGGDEGGERGLHVGRAAAKQLSIAFTGLERVGVPLIERPRGHHIRVAGEADQRRRRALTCPEIVHVANAQADRKSVV